MFGRKDQVVGSILFDNQQPPVIVQNKQQKVPVFIELEGALCEKEDDRLVYTPRGAIAINPERIAGYYDHTIMIDGYKIRVMESYAQIALKIAEASK